MRSAGRPLETLREYPDGDTETIPLETWGNRSLKGHIRQAVDLSARFGRGIARHTGIARTEDQPLHELILELKDL